MRPEPRPELLQIPDAVHGALDFAELDRLGLAPEAVVDFSMNGNPYGPSPRVREAIAQVPYERYPDREVLALRQVLAGHLDITPEQLLVGNGSTELIWLLALAFVRPGDHVVLVGPTFGEYTRAAILMGGHLHFYTAQPEESFRVVPEQITQFLQQWQPRLVFVCNPNNPTGTFVTPDVIAHWATAWPGTLFIVDEAYLTFTANAPSVLPRLRHNMLVLRSMTKAYALAGLRLGYAVGSPDVLAALQRARPPWSVNALAQAAGIAALQDTAYLTSCLERIAQAQHDLMAGLHALGLLPVPSTTHFFLMRVGHGAACRQALLERGILVRDCASFGLPDYIRVATRRPEENARLLAALAEVRPPRINADQRG
jgi:L-threonine-O-3-phosphate decarboxylase